MFFCQYLRLLLVHLQVAWKSHDVPTKRIAGAAFVDLPPHFETTYLAVHCPRWETP